MPITPPILQKNRSISKGEQNRKYTNSPVILEIILIRIN